MLPDKLGRLILQICVMWIGVRKMTHHPRILLRKAEGVDPFIFRNMAIK